MAYICYVYEGPQAVPYMEVLQAANLGEAQQQAARLLMDRPHCLSAELWDDECLVGAIDRAELVS